MPLFTRLNKDEVLDNFLRGAIYGYVVANPGEHYSTIRDALGAKNGSLTYHLTVLVREGKLKTTDEGREKRFWPMGFKVPEPEDMQLNKMQLVILEKIRQAPGITQKDLASQVGVTPPAVNYHVSVLASARLIRVVRDGKHTRCYIEEQVESEIAK